MKVDAILANLLIGAGFLGWMLWYMSSALQSWFGRSEIEAVVRMRLLRAVVLLSRSRIRSSMSTAKYVVTSAVIAGFPLMFAVLSGGRARVVSLVFFGLCVAIAGYGFALVRRLRGRSGS